MPDAREGTRQRAESAEARRERLAAELRANLKKRKAQARARSREDTAQSEADHMRAASVDSDQGA